MKKWSWECHYGSWGGPWVPKGARDEKVSPRVVRWTPPQKGSQNGPKMSKRGPVVVKLSVFVSVLKKVSKMELPRGGGIGDPLTPAQVS